MNRPLTMLVGLALFASGAGCIGTPDDRVRDACKYIRPDMMLSDANELIGWEAKFDSGSWYWTDSRKFIVHTGREHRIVDVSDFYRFKNYHKLLDREGVFVRDIENVDEEGNPINR